MAELFNLLPGIGTADNRTQGNGDDVDELVSLIGVPRFGNVRKKVVFAPPISKFEEVIRAARDFILGRKPKLLIDVLSVKTYPRGIFRQYLRGCEALLTHPMFGPDSVKANGGLSGLPIIMDKFTASPQSYSFWKEYFISKGLRAIEMDADEHDRLAAHSQGIAHFIGRVLDDFGFSPTLIDSLGAKKLHEVETLAVNDTHELFRDLQLKNPCTKAMRVKLGDSVERVYNGLLPNRIDCGTLVVGIQGGKGSPDEQATLYYLEQSGAPKADIRYLRTAEDVLRQLHEGTWTAASSLSTIPWTESSWKASRPCPVTSSIS